MSRHIQKLKKRIGLAPGTLMHIGNRKIDEVLITVIDYNSEEQLTREFKEINQVFPYLETGNVSWINIDGLHDLELLSELGQRLNIHPLFLEDIPDTGQRPKLETDENHLLLILKMITWNEKEERIDFEQISFICGNNYLVSFQEKVGDVFEAVRQRIHSQHGRIRKMGTDYLLYSLLDAVIDSYFLLLGNLSDRLEDLEEAVIFAATNEIITDIHHLKRDILYLRKSIWYLRQMISNLNREEYPQITAPVKSFMHDLNDNTVQVIDTIETYREIISGLVDLYMSNLSNRMNQVMKVLTVFAAIFIPLTFLAGVYGMNFRYMPELDWKYAYPVWWIFNIMAIGIMLLFFKRKKWL